ncbi:hypothetical protein ITF68_11010 [Acinetobacter baumannii]|nr:hypothetical protein [Acinetobacter baumannii]
MTGMVGAGMGGCFIQYFAGIEDLRSTKNKLSFLLYELGISTRDQEGFQWKQNNQK